MNANGTVFLVDDDPTVRESLGRLLQSVNLPYQIFSSAKRFLDAYADNSASPGCLVLDVRMPGMSGIELQRKLQKEGIMIPVIFVTGHGDVPMAIDAMKRGAIDFLEKPFRPQLLLDRIQEALAQDAERRRAKAERDAVAARFDRLTARERKVVDLVTTGMTNKQIAAQFGVSPQAIDANRARAMTKLQANSVPGLVRLALTSGAA